MVLFFEVSKLKIEKENAYNELLPEESNKQIFWSKMKNPTTMSQVKYWREIKNFQDKLSLRNAVFVNLN